MAEMILSALLSVVFKKLSSSSLKIFARSEGIELQLKKWERSLSQMKDVLDDASEKEVTNRAVKRWLNSLQHLAYDIDDLLDDLATDAKLTQQSAGAITTKVRKLIPTCCTCSAPSIRVHDKLNSITTELQELENEKNTFGLIVKGGKPKKKYETSLVDESAVIVGRQSDKRELLRMLLGVGDEPVNQNFSIVPIVGMGGLGKTTLARMLFNEQQVIDHFEIKIWICVSNESDIFKISSTIFQAVTKENREYADLNLLQMDLKQKLLRKRFLLVLDDVWNDSYDDWVKLMLPFHAAAPKSKIIMTTRNMQLLQRLGYNNSHHLGMLSHEDALCLFAQQALGVSNFDSRPTLRPYGDGIVEKCKGLPLALVALGKLLRTKDDEEEWKHVLNSEIWRLEDDVIVSALRLSYHDLSAPLKQLFAYCSLFPRAFVFDKEQLILLWMAEGFLHQSISSKTTEERLGHACFDELLSRSFFQHAPNDKQLFVMHDLLNDLATSVAGDFFIRFDNNMERDVRQNALEKYRHMAFVREEYGAYTKFKEFESAKSLRTFIAVSVEVKNSWQKFYLSNKILDDLLLKLPLLRVLCLSDYAISAVPESIGRLKHLRYLNLSRTSITHFPETVCNLYNLQTLIVFGCHSLEKLPNGFSKLKNLRHFDCRDTPLLNRMPLGVDQLKSRQTLSKIIVEGEHGFAITELKKLKNLHGKISIWGLDNVKNTTQAAEVNLTEKRLSELEVKWCDVFDGFRNVILEERVLNELRPHYNYLEMLRIVSYGGIKFPNWVGDPSYRRLVQVSISSCRNCEYLPPLGQLPSLRKLFIEDMDKVLLVNDELLGNGVAFPSLEILSFKNMLQWLGWSTAGREVFPCLQMLCIQNCPNLSELKLKSLPSLRALELRKCGECVLRDLVRVGSSVTTVKISDISDLTDEVWRRVIINYIQEAEEVRIDTCNELRYLWESERRCSGFFRI